MSLQVILDDLLVIDGQSVALRDHLVVHLSELPTVLLQHAADWHGVDTALAVATTYVGSPPAGVDARAAVADALHELTEIGLIEEAQ